MARRYHRFSVVPATLFVLVISAVYAPGALKTINNPQGGKIVYGPVDGATSEAQAMGAALRAMHAQYGGRPQVGKIFRVHGTNSVAAFFTVAQRSPANASLAGMVIASKFAAGHVEAAVVSDDATHFGSTINPMLKQLFGVWHPGGETQASSPAVGAANTAALHEYALPDHSASVSLPDGWKVGPSSGGGTIMAEGPNGEAVSLGFPFGAMNSSDPRVQRTMQWAQQGGGKNTTYGQALYYPYGADLGKTFVDLLQMWRSKNGLPRITIQVASESPVQSSPSERCASITGQIDPQDGKGPREMNSVFCQGPLSRMGQYMCLAYHTAVPVQFATKERATMGAILASFNVNMSVVQAQAGAIAAPAIAAIHEIGRRAAQQAAAAHEAADQHNRAVEQMWDERDKRNQAFGNYLLDQTVIREVDSGGHATVWNTTADFLMREFPGRFELVNAPDFWKGIDY